MATTAQLNTAVDLLRKFAIGKIQALVPSFEQGMAEGFVSTQLLLEAAEAVAPAFAPPAPGSTPK